MEPHVHFSYVFMCWSLVIRRIPFPLLETLKDKACFRGKSKKRFVTFLVKSELIDWILIWRGQGECLRNTAEVMTVLFLIKFSLNIEIYCFILSYVATFRYWLLSFFL